MQSAVCHSSIVSLTLCAAPWPSALLSFDDCFSVKSQDSHGGVESLGFLYCIRGWLILLHCVIFWGFKCRGSFPMWWRSANAKAIPKGAHPPLEGEIQPQLNHTHSAKCVREACFSHAVYVLWGICFITSWAGCLRERSGLRWCIFNYFYWPP